MDKICYRPKNDNLVEIRKEIENTLGKLRYSEGLITQETEKFADNLYDLLTEFYKILRFNKVKSDFCELWDKIHDLFHTTPSEKTKITDKRDITWHAIFNATVVTPWCNAKKGNILTRLRKPYLKTDFERLLPYTKKTRGILKVEILKSFKEIGSLLPPDEDDD